MVQATAGSRNSPWLEHLRQCAAEHHKRRAAEEAKATTTPPKDTATEKITDKVTRTSTLKDQGKQPKTKKAAEADNPQ